MASTKFPYLMMLCIISCRTRSCLHNNACSTSRCSTRLSHYSNVCVICIVTKHPIQLTPLADSMVIKIVIIRLKKNIRKNWNWDSTIIKVAIFTNIGAVHKSLINQNVQDCT